MSSISSFDTESVVSDLYDSESIKSKSPDSINTFNSDSSSVPGQSAIENSPTERRNATPERKTAFPVDKQSSGSRGLSEGLLNRVRKFRTFIYENPKYEEETEKWRSKSKPYSRRKDLDALAAYYYDEGKQGIYRGSKPIEDRNVSSSDFDASSLFKEWSIIQRALNTAQKNNLLSSEPENPDTDSVEEESSDDGSSRSSTSPEPETPEVSNQDSREVERSIPSKLRPNPSNTKYDSEWERVSKHIKAQNKELKKHRQDMKSFREIVRSLEANAQPTGPTPLGTASTKNLGLFQPVKQFTTRKQFEQSPHHRSPQTPPLGTEYPPTATRYHWLNGQTPTEAPRAPTDVRESTPREWQPVPGAHVGGSRHAISVGMPQPQPNRPAEMRQEQENNPTKYYDNMLNAISGIIDFKISDLGVFDPEQKACADRKHQPYWGREYNIFPDVHDWIQSVDDNWSRINRCELDIVTRNLWTLLDGPARVWWRSQLTKSDREQLQSSKEEMLQAVEKEFRLDVSDAIGILETSKFRRQDILGEASIQVFAYKIFRAAKACGETSNEYLLTRLYLALDPDLQVFVNAPKDTDILSGYVQMLEEKIKAYRRREDIEKALKVHFVGGNSHSQEGGSYHETLRSTGNGPSTIEDRNGRSVQNITKRYDLYPNSWPYERRQHYYQNDPCFPQRNVPVLQRLVTHPYHHDRRRNLGEDSRVQQGHDRGGRNEYYDYEFGTNDLEDHWDTYMAEHGVEEHMPYGFNHQRMELNRSSLENQDQSFRDRYYGQQEQSAYRPNESLTRWPPNEGLRYDSHPRLLGPPESGGNGL
ncbi:hypothetical protein FANTH_14372 [Fusarium anthophilum]|uniref:Uncharacterized protein n=1 Tax=Fusarium anthophilum TaxID=48485 RepID=A0A8H5DME8_9HYPO|nr:hypothetical protein FANTH_14372 [Fusarium anthophilum]